VLKVDDVKAPSVLEDNGDNACFEIVVSDETRLASIHPFYVNDCVDLFDLPCRSPRKTLPLS